MSLAAALLFPVLVEGQYSFDFEEGSLAVWHMVPEGRWHADTVAPLAGHHSLHHTFDSPSAGTDRLSFTPGRILFSADTLVWCFLIRYVYPPSSANHWAVFLAADRDASLMLPGAGIEAFVAGINFSGRDDLLKLWYLHNGTSKVVLNTAFNWEEELGDRPALVRIIRTPTGIWNMMIDTTLSGQHLLPLGKAQDTTRFPAYHFGIMYQYTSSRDRGLWLDNILISGTFEKDTLPPSLRYGEVISEQRILLKFSERVITGDTSFSMPGREILQTQESADETIMLFLQDPLQEEDTVTLLIRSVYDLSGNRMSDTTLHLLYRPPRWGEIVIHEIMADPSPPVGLPEAEYVELFNASSREQWLAGGELIAGTRSCPLPLIHMPAHSFLILTSVQNASLLEPYGAVLGLEEMPALLNDGMPLTLKDSHGRILSHITYSKAWYGDPFKSEGGWSLEQIDPWHPCPRRDNWTAARTYPGGSPGRQNTVFAENPDFSPATIEAHYLTGARILHLLFSEPYDPASLLNARLHCEPGHLEPDSVLVMPPEYLEAELFFPAGFSRGIRYTLHFSGLHDCSGNIIPDEGGLPFALPDMVRPGEIVINEILYNPPPGGADFVELYNRSSKVFDLGTLFFMHRDTATYRLDRPVPLVRHPLLFFPGEYRVFTTDPDAVAAEFFTSDPATFTEVQHLPPMPDDRGNIVVVRDDLTVIDELWYDEDMQFPLLRETEGVTLERVNPDGLTADRFNWHSASSDAGYGTPGLRNSQYLDASVSASASRITTEPEIISPDNDGYHDLLHIRYHFDRPGNIAFVSVYNAEGRLVRVVANNYLLGTKGEILWDGLDGEGHRPPTGIYLILIEVYDLKGNVRRYKRTCIVAGRKG